MTDFRGCFHFTSPDAPSGNGVIRDTGDIHPNGHAMFAISHPHFCGLITTVGCSFSELAWVIEEETGFEAGLGMASNDEVAQ